MGCSSESPVNSLRCPHCGGDRVYMRALVDEIKVCRMPTMATIYPLYCVECNRYFLDSRKLRKLLRGAAAEVWRKQNGMVTVEELRRFMAFSGASCLQAAQLFGLETERSWHNLAGKGIMQSYELDQHMQRVLRTIKKGEL